MSMLRCRLGEFIDLQDDATRVVPTYRPTGYMSLCGSTVWLMFGF